MCFRVSHDPGSAALAPLRSQAGGWAPYRNDVDLAVAAHALKKAGVEPVGRRNSAPDRAASIGAEQGILHDLISANRQLDLRSARVIEVKLPRQTRPFSKYTETWGGAAPPHPHRPLHHEESLACERLTQTESAFGNGHTGPRSLVPWCSPSGARHSVFKDRAAPNHWRASATTDSDYTLGAARSVFREPVPLIGLLAEGKGRAIYNIGEFKEQQFCIGVIEHMLSVLHSD